MLLLMLLLTKALCKRTKYDLRSDGPLSATGLQFNEVIVVLLMSLQNQHPASVVIVPFDEKAAKAEWNCFRWEGTG